MTSQHSAQSKAGSNEPYVCLDYGDAAVLVHANGKSYEQRWSLAKALGAKLSSISPAGVVDVVTTYEDVAIFFDPRLTSTSEIRRFVLGGEAAWNAPTADATHFDVPVVYGGTCGPDLPSVAADLGMSPEALVSLHTSQPWTIRFVGSPLGAPFLDGPEMHGSIPRLAQPRARVAPGSVAMSGRQTTIYNAASPGGWRIIGQTALSLFDRDSVPPIPYRAGDTVGFRAVTSLEDTRRPQPMSEVKG